MVLSLSITLATACFLAVGVHSNQLENTSPETQNTAEEGPKNEFNTTEFVYLDFPKIGYQIFLKKLFDALRVLDYFMGLDPMLLKITRTYEFTNNTDFNTTMNETGINKDNYMNTEEDQLIETNTESPLKITTTKPSMVENEKTNTYDISQFDEPQQDFAQDKNSYEQPKTMPSNDFQENENYYTENENTMKTEDEEVQKQAEPEEGFFSKAANAVLNVFQSVTDWF